MRKLTVLAAIMAVSSSAVFAADNNTANTGGTITNESPSFSLDIPVIKNASATDGSQSATTGGTNTNAPVDQANASATGSQAANNGGRITDVTLDVTKTVTVDVTKTVTVDVTKDNVAQAGQNGSAANNGGSAQSAQDNGVNAIVSTGSSPYLEGRGYGLQGVQIQGGQDNQQAGGNIATAGAGSVAAGADIEHSNIATGNGIVVSHGSFESLSSGNVASNAQGQTNNGSGPQSQAQGISQASLTVDGNYHVDNRAVVGAPGANTAGFGSDISSSPIQNAAGQLANNGGLATTGGSTVATKGGEIDQNSHNPVTTTQIPVDISNSLNGNALGFNGAAANSGAVTHGAGALSF